MWLLTLLLGVLVVALISAVTGYFVAQEFSYMAVDRSRLKARAAAGDRAAERALAVTQRTSFMLSGAQLGITVTALLVGYVAEPLIGASIAEALGGLDVPTAVGVGVGTALALLFSTFVQMLFGELFPKNLAIARPEGVATALAASTTAYLSVFGWLITIFDKASNVVLRIVGIEAVHDVEHAATARDLENIVATSRESGDLPVELSLLLDRILDFPTQDVHHAMIPRARVDVVRVEDTVDELRNQMRQGHSRYPVLDDEDEVVGVVHLQDLLSATGSGDESVLTLMRSPLLVPDTMSLPDALEALTTSRNQLACVLDEFGGFVGVLSGEDLAEELVGEIADEHDAEELVALPEESGSWLVSGDLPLDEVERLIGHELPSDDIETLGGLAIAVHGSFPDVGTGVTIELENPVSDELDDEPTLRSVRLDVLALERHVPSRLRVTLVEEQSTSEEVR